MRTTPLYTREELMERFGLEIHKNMDGLTGRNPQVTRIKSPDHAEWAGARIGDFLAQPPTNPNLRQTQTERVEHNNHLHWALRAESPYWQGDIFIEAEIRPGFDPVYQYFDRLREVFPQLLDAVENAAPWPQRHQPVHDAVMTMLKDSGRQNNDPPHLVNLHQRYG